MNVYRKFVSHLDQNLEGNLLSSPAVETHKSGVLQAELHLRTSS